MPRDIGGGPTTLSPRPRRRRPVDVQEEASADLGQKVAAAQAASQDSLTSDTVYGLALASDHTREVAKATAILARNGDLRFPKTNQLVVPDPDNPGEVLTVKPRDVVDPNTGSPVDLRRMRAWFRAAGLTQAIAPVLESLQRDGVRSRGLAGRRDPDTGKIIYIHQKVNPLEVASYVDAMGALPGRIPYTQALNAAVTLATRNVNREQFAQALGVLVDWNGKTETLSEAEMVGMAQWWAEHRSNPMHLADVGVLYDPAVGRAMEIPEGGPAPGQRPFAIQTYLQDVKGAADAAARSAEAYGRYDDLIHQSVDGVLSTEPSFLERALSTTFQVLDEEILQRIGGAVWIGASVFAAGDPEGMRTQGWDLLWNGGDRHNHETLGDYFAQAAGADPNSTGYNILAFGSEFAVFWFVDPLIVAGKFSRGWQLGRQVLTGTERELETAGVISNLAYGLRTRGADITDRVEGFLSSTASSRRVAGLGERTPIELPTTLPVEQIEAGINPNFPLIAVNRQSEAAGITSRLTVGEEQAAQDAFAANLARAAGVNPPPAAEAVVDITLDPDTGRYFVSRGAEHAEAAREAGLPEVGVRFTIERGSTDTMPILDIRAPKMTEAEYLYRGSLHNSEATARSYRGALGAPGVDRRVTSFIDEWGRLRYNGKVTAEAIEDTRDIFRVAIGSRPATEAGYRFREALESSGLKAVERRVNGAVRKSIGRTLEESGDEITPLVRKRLSVMVNRELMDVGLNKTFIKPILDNLRNATDDELRLLSRASKKDLRKFLGYGEEAFRGSITDQQVLNASDLMRKHVRDIGKLRTDIEGFIGTDRSAKGFVRKLRQLSTKQEYRELVKPMLDEGKELPEIIDTLVQHHSGGGIIADLVSEGGLTGGKGTLVSAMEEVRQVLGDDVAELITAGVQTQGQLRTRLRQLIAGPGSAAYGDLKSGALQLGVPTWTDQLGLLEGVQRVYPSTGGFLQGAHEAQLRVADSRFWQGRATEWMRSVYEKNPPGLLNIEGFNAAEGMGRWLHDMHVPGAKVDEALGEMRRLITSRGGMRETKIGSFMKKWIAEGYRSMGIPEEQVAEIMRKMRPHYDYISKLINNRGKVAAETGMEAMAEPPLETLLKNIWTLPSPNEMDIAMRRAFGRFHGVQRKAADMFNGKLVADLTKDEWNSLIDDISRTRVLYARGAERTGIWADHIRNTWVAWQLLRPGWALKVLPDENFRALVMLHDLFDRVSAVSAYAKLFDRLGVRGREMVVHLVDGTEQSIELRLPGLLPHEAEAAQGLMHGTMLKSTAWKQAQLAKAIKASLSPLEPGSKDFFQIWAHLLDRRVMGSDLGTWIMKSLAADVSDGRPWTWGRVVDNARANPRIWQALRLPGEDVEEVVQRAWTYVTQAVSTKGQINKDLIDLALRGEITPNKLKGAVRGLAERDLPTLPALETEEAVAVRAPLLGNARDTLTDWLMRRPSDWLNRNPLYKALYQRELERLIKVETAAGRRFSRSELALIQTGEHPLAMTARGYALDRELGTMFTYLNNSHFSEAARHIFPFFSPYQEQYTVWGRLLWENPHIAEQTRLMAKLATDTKVIYKDENTGEWMINAKVLAAGLATTLLFSPAAIAPLASAFGAAAIQNWRGLPDSSWAVPVNNLNLFLSNTLTVGGIPIPTPGLSPPFEFLANKAAEQTGDFPFKANLVNYFSAYGTDLSVLPASWHKALTAVFPRFDPGLYESTKNHMLDALILQGFELVDERGREIPGAAAELDKTASNMARDWLLLRAVNQFTQPTAPTAFTEADEVRDEFFDLIEQHGYKKASKILQERYPDAPNVTMLGIGYSLWNQEGPSIPPTLEASAILSTPEFEKAAKEYPELAFFLIPNEFRDGTYDYEEARRQLDSTLRVVNPGIVMQGDRVTGGRAAEYLRNQGWEEFYTIESTFRAKLKATGTSEGDQGYEALKERWRDRPLEQLQKQNLIWANDYQLHEVPFLDETLNKLRTVMDLPIWRDTEMGKALHDYFAVADPMRQTMYDNNITALDTASAEELGLDKQYKDLTTMLEERYPNTWPYLERYWLGDDFKNIDTHRDDVLKRVGADTQWVKKVLTPWEQRWNAAGRRITDADTQTEESAAFLELNRLSLQAQRLGSGPGGINPQELWWETQTLHEQSDTRMRVAQKPYVFLTTFERRNILGIETSNAVEKAFITIGEAKVTVNRAIDNGADASTVWGKFDDWVKKEIYPVPGMRKAIKQAHGFGFALFRNIPKEWQQGTEGDAWKAIKQAANNIHEAFRGAEFVDDEEFRKVQVVFGEYISQWEDYSPDFKDHVNYLREISGDQLNEVLMPELWWILI